MWQNNEMTRGADGNPNNCEQPWPGGNGSATNTQAPGSACTTPSGRPSPYDRFFTAPSLTQVARHVFTKIFVYRYLRYNRGSCTAHQISRPSPQPRPNALDSAIPRR
jgi:hypothetical protein